MILRNGLIVQWRKKYANNTRVNFAMAFSNTCVYFNFIVARSNSTSDGWHYYNTPKFEF
ncbi:gp53-like domain-containing protein [Treponema pectinovorum]